MPAPEILLLTALKLEQDAVVAKLSDVESCQIDGFPAFRGSIGATRVHVACFHRKGNVNSAARTATILREIRPSHVILVGIAGGTDRPASEVQSAGQKVLGDVLVAEQIVDYESGKLTPGGVESRPRVYPAGSRLLAAARGMNPSDWVHHIQQPRPDGSTGRRIPVVHFGTIASGEKVVTDPVFTDSLKAVWRELVGMEMEGFGAALACLNSEHHVDFLLAKAICDWADPAKNDEWQPYAADAAASFAAALVRTLVGPISNGDANPLSLGLNKLDFTRRLRESWRELADCLHIPLHDLDRFERGAEPRGIWEWLEVRNRLPELRAAVQQIGRADLLVETPDYPC